jgi:hypothetical protein
MTIYCVGDVHLANRRMFGGDLHGGLNGRARDIAAVLGLAYSWAKDGEFVILGDLFDTHSPTPAIIRAAQKALEYDSSGQTHTHVIVGNHDMASDAEGDNACSPLAPIANVVEAKPSIIVDDDETAALLVPFKTPVRDAIVKALHYAEKQEAWKDCSQRVLLGHWGISAASDPPYLRTARDAISADELFEICEFHDVNGVCAGNWHGRREFAKDGVHILQVGALCPTGFDNPGWDGYGTLAWWNSQDGRFRWKEIPGPRFLTHLPSKEELKQHADCKIYARPDAADVEEAADLVEKIRALPITGHPRIVASEAEKEKRVTAATSARSATTVGKAIAAYIEEISLPTGVDREEVLATVRHYLERS